MERRSTSSTRPADPSKVVFFLEGGGACFTPESCAFTDEPTTLYDWNIGADDDPARMSGIFDLANAENPFADYSFVYVPYCTGDVHLGDSAHEYSADLTVEHRGWVNGNAAVSYLAEHYADGRADRRRRRECRLDRVAPYAATIGDVLPDAQITVFADGSGGYPDNGQLSVGMEALWGFVRPDWAADVPIEEWTVPGMVEAAGVHNPDIVMSRFDYAYDAVQAVFLEVLGITDPLLPVVDANEARFEAAGVNQFSFTAPGTEHTLVRKPVFYEMELNGVRFVDWVTSIVNGESVEDVHCRRKRPSDRLDPPAHRRRRCALVAQPILRRGGNRRGPRRRRVRLAHRRIPGPPVVQLVVVLVPAQLRWFVDGRAADRGRAGGGSKRW